MFQNCQRETLENISYIYQQALVFFFFDINHLRKSLTLVNHSTTLNYSIFSISRLSFEKIMFPLQLGSSLVKIELFQSEISAIQAWLLISCNCVRLKLQENLYNFQSLCSAFVQPNIPWLLSWTEAPLTGIVIIFHQNY